MRSLSVVHCSPSSDTFLEEVNQKIGERIFDPLLERRMNESGCNPLISSELSGRLTALAKAYQPWNGILDLIGHSHPETHVLSLGGWEIGQRAGLKLGSVAQQVHGLKNIRLLGCRTGQNQPALDALEAAIAKALANTGRVVKVWGSLQDITAENFNSDGFVAGPPMRSGNHPPKPKPIHERWLDQFLSDVWAEVEPLGPREGLLTEPLLVARFRYGDEQLRLDILFGFEQVRLYPEGTTDAYRRGYVYKIRPPLVQGGKTALQEILEQASAIVQCTLHPTARWRFDRRATG